MYVEPMYVEGDLLLGRQPVNLDLSSDTPEFITER
jgi:hypothetical protein